MTTPELAGPHPGETRQGTYSAPGALNALALEIPPETLRQAAQRMLRDAEARALTIEGSDKVARPISLALRPRLVTAEQRSYIHRLVWQLRTALERAIELRRSSAQVRRLLPLDPDEESWFRLGEGAGGATPGAVRPERIFMRFDAIASLGGPDWRDSIRVIEPNVVGIGGIRYSPLAEALVLEHLVPLYAGLAPGFECAPNDDVRELLWDELVSHARGLGAAAGETTVALVDDKTLYSGPGECGFLTAILRARGRRAVYADPRELEIAGGEIRACGERVDVVFRFLDSQDLSAIEARGEGLSALRRAFARGAAVPSSGGDIEHKGVLELFTSAAWEGSFTRAQVALFHRHVPWTRVVFDRRTTGPDGAEVDIAEFVRARRESLVLKPNRGSGGEGVHLGGETPPGRWDAVLGEALARPASYVVQSECPCDLQGYPVVQPDGSVGIESLHAVCGFFAAAGGLGIFGRVSRERVVNIHRGGGIVAFLAEGP